MGQPDLDFLAPEVQTQSICAPQSDMFSLGLLVAYLFSGGRPLLSANLTTSTYLRQLDAVRASAPLFILLYTLLTRQFFTKLTYLFLSFPLLSLPPQLSASLNELLPNVPSILHDILKGLLEIDYKKRPTSQQLSNVSTYLLASDGLPVPLLLAVITMLISNW